MLKSCYLIFLCVWPALQMPLCAADVFSQKQELALLIETKDKESLALRALNEHWLRLGGDYAGCEGAQWIRGKDGVELIYAAHHDFLLFRWSQAQGLRLWKGGTAELSTLRPFAGGYYAVEQGSRQVIVLSKDLKSIELVADRFEGKLLNRPNDLRLRPGKQTLWFTDPNFLFKQRPDETQELSGQYVFCYDATAEEGKKLTAVIRDLELPNGIVFNEDGSRLYIGDSKTKTVWGYALDDAGAIQGDVTKVARFDRGIDGISLAPDGRLWVALSNGVAIISQEGLRLGFLPLPERCTSMDFIRDGDSYWVAITTSKAAHVARFQFLKIKQQITNK